ncbi:MAG: hypothetical protein CFE46_17800 [Burkholderiales bacterium PBB6]|nr:MAG: hypothetical protein CFE46_17800 [Burkholderiales bacterium PBB6]
MVRRGGYNAVRVHMVEAMLMDSRRGDFNFDPQQLDRLHYLLGALRKQGMYLFVDMLGSWNGAYGDLKSHRWARGQHDAVLGSLLPGDEREHWLALVKKLWVLKNPYTGQSTLQDTALAGVVLVNEGAADFLLRKGPSPVLLASFQQWLVKQFGSQGAAQQALGAWPTESTLPRVQDTSPMGAAFQRYTAELQDEQVDWMKGRLAEFGYKGPVTAFNAGMGLHAMRGQRQLSFTDMHSYADHPAGGAIEPGTKLNQWRLLDGRNRYFDFLAWSRAWGKPFTVTEYGQPFWNTWRWEVGPFTAAYARLQNWSLIAHYGDTFNLSRPGKGKWRQMIVPFDTGTDPTLRAGETIAAFLFARGDVSPSKVSVAMNVDPAFAASQPADTFVNWNTAQFQYVAAVGVDIRGAAQATSANRLALSWKEDGIKAPELAQRMAAQAMLPKDVAQAVTGGRYLSSTKELALDTKRMVMTIVTPASVGLLGSTGAKVEGAVSTELIDGEGAVVTSVLDAQDLSRGGRALTVISTDSRNSGMQFLDTENKVLGRLGTFPVQLHDATAKVTMPAPPTGKRWRLYALDFTGRRTTELKVEELGGRRAAAVIKLSSLGDAVTPYFEWLAE